MIHNHIYLCNLKSFTNKSSLHFYLINMINKYLTTLFVLLLSGCGVQKPPQQSNAESNDLVYKQYLQFLNYMLFEIGDKDTAIESLFKSAKNRNVEAQIELGGCYAYRPDLIGREKPNIDSAIIWWCKAAEQNEWMAQRNLAFYYADKQDWEQAKYWLKQAKRNGYKDKELQNRINKNLK